MRGSSAKLRIVEKWQCNLNRGVFRVAVVGPCRDLLGTTTDCKWSGSLFEKFSSGRTLVKTRCHDKNHRRELCYRNFSVNKTLCVCGLLCLRWWDRVKALLYRRPPNLWVTVLVTQSVDQISRLARQVSSYSKICTPGISRMLARSYF